MKRDGFNESLWQHDIPAFDENHTSYGEMVFDVVIVGGGITGVTTALLLQQAGKKCLLAEAHELCFGTTSGTSAHLNNFFDKSYSEVERDFGLNGSRMLAAAAKDALELYKKNIESLHIDCDFTESDGVLFGFDKKDDEELDEILHATINAGVGVQFTNKTPVPIPFSKAISFPFQAQIHPVKYVYGLARAFKAAGGIIVENTMVTKVEEGDLLNIQTSKGLVKAKKLIYATHIPPGVNLLHLRCAPYRSYVMAVELADGNYPADPCYDMLDPYHYYRTHTIGNKKYLVAGGEDHKTGHEENTELPFEKLESHLRQYFKVESVAFKWSSQYFETVDGLAYIGHLPGSSENIFVASGFGGNGMTYSHIAAHVLTTTITTGEIPYDQLFSPARIKPVAGFSTLIKESADVVASFVGDRLKIAGIDSLSEIGGGTARVVKYDHRNIAIHKSANGAFTAINPTCTHLKCLVKWNQTEQSWDCPCHGARYSVSGEVLTGPSVKALEQVNIEH